MQDPFKTTRKMKVPMHSRMGHRERAYIMFAKICFWLSVIGVFLALLATALR